MTGVDAERFDDQSEVEYPDVPDWEDEYVDRVSDRLMFNYDLEKDRVVQGERFDLYGAMNIESQKQFLHPSINFANHASYEHLFARRMDSVRVADLEHLVAFGHDLADEWIDANEQHYGTDFTFVVVVPEIPDAVRSFVADFRDRTLLKYGYHGHYELNLVVVAPDHEDDVSSQNADAASAFRLWEDVTRGRSGLLSRLVGALRR